MATTGDLLYFKTRQMAIQMATAVVSPSVSGRAADDLEEPQIATAPGEPQRHGPYGPW